MLPLMLDFGFKFFFGGYACFDLVIVGLVCLILFLNFMFFVLTIFSKEACLFFFFFVDFFYHFKGTGVNAYIDFFYDAVLFPYPYLGF